MTSWVPWKWDLPSIVEVYDWFVCAWVDVISCFGSQMEASSRFGIFAY